MNCRETVCCGTLYRGLLGEVMVDTRHWTRCSAHDTAGASDITENNNNIQAKHEDVPMTVESLIESELKKLADAKSDEIPVATSDIKTAVGVTDEAINNNEVKHGAAGGDHDEGFCDKSSTVTGPSSPDSANLVLEDE